MIFLVFSITAELKFYQLWRKETLIEFTLILPNSLNEIPQFGGKEIRGEEMTAEGIKKQMTELEWNKVYEMSRDKNLYQNLISSLFPTVHGNDEVKRGETNFCRFQFLYTFVCCEFTYNIFLQFFFSVVFFTLLTPNSIYNQESYLCCLVESQRPQWKALLSVVTSMFALLAILLLPSHSSWSRFVVWGSMFLLKI